MTRMMMILILLFGMTAAAAAWLASAQVHRFSAPYIGSDPERVPERKAALLLGTAPQLEDGSRNLYFDYRISAAAKLYRQGKIRHIIASGSNLKHDANEPDAMIAELIKLGVPAEKITADYAGLRTLDSVLRARDVFGQDSFIVVSQKFHNERAVYLARAHGMDVYGYNAADVGKMAGWKTRLREYGARLKMFWDLKTDKTAKYEGDKIVLPDD